MRTLPGFHLRGLRFCLCTGLLIGLVLPPGFAQQAGEELHLTAWTYLPDDSVALPTPVIRICLGDTRTIGVQVEDRARKPVANATVRFQMPGGSKTRITQANGVVHSMDVPSEEGREEISILASKSKQVSNIVFLIFQIEKCEEKIETHYQGRFRLEAGAGPVFTPAQTETVRGIRFGAGRPREDFAWLATETALMDDVVLEPDADGRRFTGSGQLWYTLRVWGSGTFMNCSMDPEIEVSAAVKITAQKTGEMLDVAMEIAERPPLTPAITLRCTVFDGSKISLGPLPVSGTVDPSALGLDRFVIPVQGGIYSHPLSRGIGFTAPGQGSSAAIVIREPPETAGLEGGSSAAPGPEYRLSIDPFGLDPFAGRSR